MTKSRRNRKFDVRNKEVGGSNISALIYQGDYSKSLPNPGDAVYVKTIARRRAMGNCGFRWK